VAQTSVCEALSLEFRLQAVFALRERLPPKDGTPKLKSVPLVESYDKAPDVLRRKSFSRVRGQSYALRLALFVFLCVLRGEIGFTTEDTEKNEQCP